LRACGGILADAWKHRGLSAAPDLLAIRSAAERLFAPSHGVQENHCRAMNKGYDANSQRNRLKAQGTDAVIPCTRSRRRPILYDREACRDRNMIERAFCSLKDYRRIATRYDKLLRNFLSAVEIAAVILWWT
jgi:putative transposase